MKSPRCRRCARAMKRKPYAYRKWYNRTGHYWACPHCGLIANKTQEGEG